MRSWSKRSKKVYDTLDPRLQWLCDELLGYMNVSLTYGHRTEEQQNALYPKFTQVRWPDSKHNTKPSLAVDLQPYPYPRNENDLRAALGYMAGLSFVLAGQGNFKIRWGGDWNRNGDVTDNGFDDLFHIEVHE